jgi:hypothetical protein
MTPGIRPLVAGNWKMNGTGGALNELLRVGRGFMSGLETETDALVCVPATLVSRAHQTVRDTPVAIGGQDCHAAESGAHTGDISAEMLKDAGATHVIVGHSERRADHGETDTQVRAKAEAAWRAFADRAVATQTGCAMALQFALVTPRMGTWKARFSFRPLRQNELVGSEFASWNSGTRFVVNSPESQNWAAQNAGDINSKRAQYWREWNNQGAAERAMQTLNPEDGRM